MKLDLTAALRRARAGDPLGAVRSLGSALFGGSGPDGTGGTAAARADEGETRHVPAEEDPPVTNDMELLSTPRPSRSLGATLKLLEQGRAAIFAPPLARSARVPEIPAGARFETRVFTCSQGSREYRLYVPSQAEEGLRGLVVMLHGCKQDASDFAVGTGMNAQAEQERLLVAYPCQGAIHNPLRCWNWFSPAHQQRDSGEPAIIAGIARSLLEEFPVERHRTMVAGLSAGGSMAAVLGATYPDLFSTVGIHSGVPYGVAQDTATAIAAMRGEPSETARSALSCRTIVFHGDADRTVHPDNAARLFAAAGLNEVRREEGVSMGGRAYRVERSFDGDDACRLELWTIEGAGHAWSGGDPAGSYTDPDGPDASAEIIRFMLHESGAVPASKRRRFAQILNGLRPFQT